ncbi:nitrogenase molybdenum-iron cofactor biosynthesis protein NifE [Mesorhizobium australicum WSM2073]|uniref:Nitrogenase iron-molybdenum cofactor biosynthesis protein NifE n=3 Tax=Mesorhizobium TaxID=68287 RepID=L0KRN0_MESAW|nr:MULTISPECIES: nitrogenase iron-molybdenum cofactor biosynthesis protein NifE [Mesorhizobium]ADV14839.1 nitrogenase MoFe cofactor biosynthesis protein NifE [Mesorhizobium ciceri biovar biserrulae WSM1271]AEH90729.1 nitrogenase MoFe cofactor biosynthesis protein NifE [Mesorhizobium opportunistum WSM2075]AGB48097.1 nitrogenase molybdenum-iron cofactor biosynthesis protein NifE [Mesorhizobium australicum WSM2073]OBP84786.1 nitrogenase iron-molybdenum cofactor biosynthesis protein NifE [Mesorhizo
MTALSAKIQDVFDEPACDKNRGKDAKARKEGCARPLTPGAAAGGCAFDGAKIVLQPITDVAHLVHAPLACEGNSWDNRGAASSGPTLWRTSFTTDLTEFDVVMGRGERKLFKAIRQITETYAPAAVFVYSTCVTALIGDDIEAVCKRAAEKFGLAVVPVNAPGLAGSKNLGNKLAAEALLDHVIGTVEPDDAGPYDINILGEFNLCGEFWLVKPLLDRLGIRVRACIPGDARYRDVASGHSARAAMVVCSTALITLARKMEERWGIPFFEGSFYGISDTSEALRRIAKLLVRKGADPEILDRAETLIAEQEAVAWKKLEAYRPRLQGKRVLLNTGGVKSWSVVHALMEIGMEIVGTSVKKSTPEDKVRIQQMLKDDNHMFEQMSARDLYAILSGGKADIMLSGGRTQFVALKAKTPWLDINQERQHPYAGYDGMVELVRQIDLAIHNPIWRQVRERPPWDCQPDGKHQLPSANNDTATTRAVQNFAATTRTISAVEEIL